MKFTLFIATLAALEMAAAADPTAENHFDAGQQAYDRGDFPVAIQEWQESYRLSGESALLFNIAQAMRLSGDCPKALATYRRFIADDPTSEQKTLAEDLARELEGKCGEKPKPKSSIESPRPVPPSSLTDHEDRVPPGRTLKIAGVAVGGAGVATLAIGLAFGHHASSLGDEVTSACRTTCDWTQWKDKDAEGRRDAAVGRVLDVVGIAAIVGGATLYYLGRRESMVSIEPTRSSASGAVVSWSGSW